MILDLTSDELKAVQALDDSYKKLLDECEALILKLRPDDPEPDEDEYRRIQDSRLPEPIELRPEPIEVRDGTPVFSKEALDAYHNTAEYRAYAEANKRANDAVTRQWDNWYNGGSKEWKEARKKYERLQKEYSEALTAFFQKVEDRQFNALGGDLSRILEDARSQVDRIIPNKYQYYEKMREGGSFQARDVRLQSDKSFRLDTTETRENIKRALKRHYEALAEDPSLVKQLDQYIEAALKMSTFVSDDGELFGEVSMLRKSDSTLVARPSKYSTTVDKISGLLFANEITKPVDADPEAAYEIVLGGTKKKPVIASASIDYAELLSNKAIQSVPDLESYDYTVHDAIVTHILAGNRIITVDMIYRAMTGKVDGKVNVSDEIFQKIKKSLGKFNGRLFIDFQGTDASGEPITLHFNEPLLMYSWIETKIHGKSVAAIRVPYDADPVLLKWARLNGNEIDTRDITLRDIPRLNNGEESATIRDYLYRRIIAMRNGYDRAKRRHKPFNMSRKIRFETLYKELGISDPNKDKKLAIKSKVDRCLKYWEEQKLIVSYQYTKKSGTNQYDGVEINFIHETTEKSGSSEAQSD
jgi:hypothetical protein